MRQIVKKLARVLFGDYSAYHIYSRSIGDAAPPQPAVATHFRVALVEESAIRSCSDPLIREQAGYAGPGSLAYACFDGNRIVGLCFYWFGKRYLQRNFWPLADAEAKLVHIASLPDMRERGVASILITASCRDLMEQGFCRAIARIWHSNTPSVRAFERAGWRRIALVCEIHPLRRKRPIRLQFDTKLARTL